MIMIRTKKEKDDASNIIKIMLHGNKYINYKELTDEEAINVYNALRIAKDVLLAPSVDRNNPPLVLDMNEAASLLNISKTYLYKLVQHREITYYKGKGGKKTYFKREDVLSFMLNRKMPSNEELRQESAAYNVRQKGKRRI